MLLPIGDMPNYSRVRPWVNWGLIAANVVVFLAARLGSSAGEYQGFVARHGFVPLAPGLDTFFSSMFVHADLLHLGGNMLFLWVFGDNVEGRLGHVGYLLAYLAAGLAAVLLFRVLDPLSTVPLVGASGAIFGVEGFYFLAFGHNRVRVIYWFWVVGSALIPARVMLGLSFVLNLLYMLVQGQGIGGGVAYAAHVGGFVLGFLLALALKPFAPHDEMSVPAWRPAWRRRW